MKGIYLKGIHTHDCVRASCCMRRLRECDNVARTHARTHARRLTRAHTHSIPTGPCSESTQERRNSPPTSCTSPLSTYRTRACSPRVPRVQHPHGGATGGRGARRRRRPSSDERQGCPWPARGETGCAADCPREMQWLWARGARDPPASAAIGPWRGQTLRRAARAQVPAHHPPPAQPCPPRTRTQTDRIDSSGGHARCARWRRRSSRRPCPWTPRLAVHTSTRAHARVRAAAPPTPPPLRRLPPTVWAFPCRCARGARRAARRTPGEATKSRKFSSEGRTSASSTTAASTVLRRLPRRWPAMLGLVAARGPYCNGPF